MGIRLMIIELRKYNEIEELLIGDRNARSQAQVGYWDIDWEAFVTRVAVCMGVKETGMTIPLYLPLGWRDPNQGQVQGNSQPMFTENAEEAPYAPYADHTPPHAPPNVPHTPLLATRAPVLLKNLSRN